MPIWAWWFFLIFGILALIYHRLIKLADQDRMIRTKLKGRCSPCEREMLELFWEISPI